MFTKVAEAVKTKPGCNMCDYGSGNNKRKRWVLSEFDNTDDDDDDIKPISKMKTHGPPDEKTTPEVSQTPKVKK